MSARQIVFDLDGTLVQTRVSSWEVFREVQAEFDLGIDTDEKFFALLEKNLFVALREACSDERTADAVSARFLEKLESDYRPELVPGIADVVRALASRATLAVLSSNSTAVIRRVLIDNDLAYCFSHVFGGDVEPDKSAGLQRFVADAAQGVGRRCVAPYDEGSTVDQVQTVLVTDTTGDTAAALSAGVRVVGVSWGMHSPEALRDAGAEFVAMWPQELIAHLRPAGMDAPSCSVKTPQSPSMVRRQRRLDVGVATLPRAAEPHCGCPAPVSADEELLLAMRRTF
ncbi:MAG: HAD family hydrolase [Microbacterium sp.]